MQEAAEYFRQDTFYIDFTQEELALLLSVYFPKAYFIIEQKDSITLQFI